MMATAILQPSIEVEKYYAVKALEKRTGPPYSPEGWGWKVGRRSDRSGYWVDRYWFPPWGPMLSSGKELEAYIAEEYPSWVFEDFMYPLKIAALQMQTGEAHSCRTSAQVCLVKYVGMLRRRSNRSASKRLLFQKARLDSIHINADRNPGNV